MLPIPGDYGGVPRQVLVVDSQVTKMAKKKAAKKKASATSIRTKKVSGKKKTAASLTRKNTTRKSTAERKSNSASTGRTKKTTASKKKEAKTAEQSSATASTNDNRGGIVLNLPSIDTMAVPTVERPFVVEYFPSPAQFRAELQVRNFELESQRNCASRVLSRVRSKWTAAIRQSGQHASINVGFRTKFGQVVAPLQYVILVDISDKLPRNIVECYGLFQIPRVVDGVPVKVRQLRVSNMAGTAKGISGTLEIPLSESTEAVKGGDAIEATGDGIVGDWGTLGMCFPNSVGDLIGLTNHHVVGVPGNVVTTASGDSVGTVADPVGTNPVNDAAAIDGASDAVFLEGLADLDIDPETIKFLENEDVSDLFVLKNNNVFKVGAAMPDVVVGTITILQRNVPVPNLAARDFENVMEIQNNQDVFIRPGDSGSILMQLYTNGDDTFPLVVGVNFAGTEDGHTAYAFPFGRVIKDLDLTVMPDRLFRIG